MFETAYLSYSATLRLLSPDTREVQSIETRGTGQRIKTLRQKNDCVKDQPCLGEHSALWKRSVQKYLKNAESETEKSPFPAKSVQKNQRKVFETAHPSCGATLRLLPHSGGIYRQGVEINTDMYGEYFPISRINEAG